MRSVFITPASLPLLIGEIPFHLCLFATYQTVSHSQMMLDWFSVCVCMQVLLSVIFGSLDSEIEAQCYQAQRQATRHLLLLLSHADRSSSWHCSPDNIRLSASCLLKSCQNKSRRIESTTTAMKKHFAKMVRSKSCYSWTTHPTKHQPHHPLPPPPPPPPSDGSWHTWPSHPPADRNLIMWPHPFLHPFFQTAYC